MEDLYLLAEEDVEYAALCWQLNYFGSELEKARWIRLIKEHIADLFDMLGWRFRRAA